MRLQKVYVPNNSLNTDLVCDCTDEGEGCRRTGDVQQPRDPCEGGHVAASGTRCRPLRLNWLIPDQAVWQLGKSDCRKESSRFHEELGCLVFSYEVCGLSKDRQLCRSAGHLRCEVCDI